ncbi:aspartate dehydrogenase [Paenibacillus antri]|uniref:L-aspartate dehydrogenase n=1 Tax=Paenibacillus antri TaxID=2582848 RepID=A0A5R9GJK2_9BACL|nr:aspartate dehydrogenase [Paenibacillus antri]TLS53618.1 aspartate dehydrogenase [Paenibacillus antri]
MIRIGIIGYGTIGEDVAEAVRAGKAGDASVASVLVRDKRKYVEQGRNRPFDFIDDPDTFFLRDHDVVVECAGHEAVRMYGEAALRSGADLMVVSVGAFAEDGLLRRLVAKAAEAGRKIIVPSAAIGGLDRIAAGSVGPMEEVTLTTRKPPKAWYGTVIERQVDLAGLSEPYLAFEGAARDAAKRFPESVNVSAALSLAGIGFDATKVKVFADPTIEHNTHEIAAQGLFGRIRLEIRNTPSDRNPKTGYIVAMSVVKNIKDRTSPFVIGT